jgi:hypothetical protein
VVFAVASTGQYRIVGPAFLYADRDGKRAYTMFGYPTQALTQMAATSGGHNTLQLLSRARAKISNMFG